MKIIYYSVKYHSRIRLCLIMLSVVFSFNCKLMQAQPGVRPSLNGINELFFEQLEITTDRKLYIAGEEVFMKIGKFNANNSRPEDISKIVYVDLNDVSGNPVIREKFLIDGASGAAWFKIPDTLSTGNYFVRAYTSWMKNYGPGFYALTGISVINPFENIRRLKVPEIRMIPDTIRFFPESGSLVAGVLNRTGVRSTAGGNVAFDFSGFVLNSKSDTLCMVQSDKYGEAVLNLVPRANDTLTLVVEGINGSYKSYGLPPVMNAGVAFTVVDDTTGGLFRVRTGSAGISPALYKMIYAPISMDPSERNIYLPADSVVLLNKSDYPAGLARLEIVDQGGRKVAGRWIWNERREKIGIDLKIATVNPGIREKVSFEITATDFNGQPLECDLSVSVVKHFTVNGPAMPYLFSPAAAASESNNYVTQGLPLNDRLLLAGFNETHQGTDRSTGPLIDFLPEVNGYNISGLITNASTGEPLRNEKLTMSFVGKRALCSFSSTDSSGRFVFNTKVSGLREIVIQPLEKMDDGYNVEIDNPFLVPPVTEAPAPFFIDTTYIREINNAVISSQVMRIYSFGHRKDQPDFTLPEETDFFDSPDKVIDLSQFIELNTIREVIKEIVPGVSTRASEGVNNFRMINRNPGRPLENNPFVVLDGVPVNDIEPILNVRPALMESIGIVNTRYYITNSALDGIISFVSRKGDMSVIDFDRSVFRREYQGLQLPNLPVAPDYSTPESKAGRIPDLRNTLYWNPGLTTGRNGRAEGEFFTSDETGVYVIEIKGVTADGRRAYSRQQFIVDQH